MGYLKIKFNHDRADLQSVTPARENEKIVSGHEQDAHTSCGRTQKRKAFITFFCLKKNHITK